MWDFKTPLDLSNLLQISVLAICVRYIALPLTTVLSKTSAMLN